MTTILERSIGEDKLKISTEGLDLLNNLNKKVMVITILYPCIRTDHEVTIRLVQIEESIICVLDASSLWERALSDESINPENFTLLLCLMLSSLLIVVFPPQDPRLSMDKLSFIRGFLYSFDGDVSRLKSVIGYFPDMIITQFVESSASLASSKQMVETLMKSESGFSTEVAMRNQLREIMTEILPLHEIIPLPLSLPLQSIGSGSESGLESNTSLLSDVNYILSQEDIRRRISDEMCQEVELCGVTLTGPLLAQYVSAIVSQCSDVNHFPLSTVRTEVVTAYIQTLSAAAMTQYEQHMTTMTMTSVSESFSSLSLSDITRIHSQCRARALGMLTGSTGRRWGLARDARKSLQTALRLKLQREMLLSEQRWREHCESVLLDIQTETQTQMHGDIQTQTLRLGESVSAFSELLRYKGILERTVSRYISETTSSQSSPTYSDNNSDSDRALEISSDVLKGFLILQLGILSMQGHQWMEGFKRLVAATEEEIRSKEEERNTLETRHGLQENSLSDGAVSAMEGEVSGLQQTLSTLRLEHAVAAESSQSKLEGLMDRMDRIARLNEQEKNELAQELMSIQHRILKAQDRALDLRQQREVSTTAMHRDLLTGEQDCHVWFKATVSRRHSLLETELALEREIAMKRSEHANVNFNMETQYMRQVEESRVANQRAMCVLREEALKEKEGRATAHELAMTQRRAQLAELEAKYVLMTDAYDRSNEKKACVVNVQIEYSPP
eukprot:gene6687-13547_t